MVSINVGDRAPDFSLIDNELRHRSLGEFLGQNVLLVFFIESFTDICDMEECPFRNSMDKLIDLDVQVLGISFNNPSKNKEYVKENFLPFPVLSDSKFEVIKLYGLFSPDPLAPKTYIVEKPAIFVIDQDGIVRYAWVSSDLSRVRPDYNLIQEQVEKLLRLANA